MIIHRLMYDDHTSYSYHKSENLCRFGCRKGFYDEVLLKEHIRMRQCLTEDESSEIVEEVEEVTDLETGPYGCVPCSLGFPTIQDLSIHVFCPDNGCRYIDDSIIQTHIPVKEVDTRRIGLPIARLFRRPLPKRVICVTRHSSKANHPTKTARDSHAEDCQKIAENLLRMCYIDFDTDVVTICGYYAKSHRLPTMHV
jgi:hypothetical protein